MLGEVGIHMKAVADALHGRVAWGLGVHGRDVARYHDMGGGYDDILEQALKVHGVLDIVLRVACDLAHCNFPIH